MPVLPVNPRSGNVWCVMWCFSGNSLMGGMCEDILLKTCEKMLKMDTCYIFLEAAWWKGTWHLAGGDTWEDTGRLETVLSTTQQWTMLWPWFTLLSSLIFACCDFIERNAPKSFWWCFSCFFLVQWTHADWLVESPVFLWSEPLLLMVIGVLIVDWTADNKDWN